MIQYPVSFHTKASADFGIAKTWSIESQNVKGICAIPPEFEGPGGALSPEDLFAQALTSCFIATFKVYAEKSKIQFSQLFVETKLLADLNELKKPVMKTCMIKVTILGAANADRIKTIAEKAFQSGFIINSVKTDVRFELSVL